MLVLSTLIQLAKFLDVKPLALAGRDGGDTFVCT